MSDTPLARAIAIAGGSRPLGEHLGITRQAVEKWHKHGVPAHQVLAIERLTGVSRYDLRPDVFGDLATARPFVPRERAVA